MKLIAGLGNPGIEYKWNRHNVGFIVIDAFAKYHKLTMQKNKRYSYYLWKDAVLMKPKTFMNRSGSAISSFMVNQQMDDCLIIVDDLHLEFGEIRLRSSGGSGGHNGLKSVQEALGSNEFKRMRIGIGHASPKNYSEYVLDDFSEKEIPYLAKLCAFTNRLLDEFISGDFQQTVAYYSKNKTTYSKEFEDLRIERPKEKKNDKEV
jgi:peptidyl-tRNA hydrolase, PTH1 family